MRLFQSAFAMPLFLLAGIWGGLAKCAWAQNQSLTVAGKSRNYVLHVPASVSAKPPLVFVIHGFNMTGQQEVQLTRMNTVSDREKFIVVYPDALKNSSNQPSWDLSGPDDYRFLLDIIDTLAAKYQVDRNRVYASGFSQGGFMAFQLGCRYADVFAAIAPVSGTLNGTCNPSRPVPMFLTFGTVDAAPSSSFMKSVTSWGEIMDCPTSPKITQPYPSTNARSVVTRLEYGPCKDGTTMIADSVKGGPHEWPMDTRTKVNNSEEVWSFFKDYALNAPVPAWNSRNQTALTPNPNLNVHRSPGQMELRQADENARVKVLDHSGRILAQDKVRNGVFGFPDLPGGLYFVIAESKSQTQTVKFVTP